MSRRFALCSDYFDYFATCFAYLQYMNWHVVRACDNWLSDNDNKSNTNIITSLFKFLEVTLAFSYVMNIVSVFFVHVSFGNFILCILNMHHT